MEQLKAAGCRTIYINGSFVTTKAEPGDFDACWDKDDVDIDYLRKNAPTLSIDFFQRDREQNPKGIIAIDLLRWEP